MRRDRDKSNNRPVERARLMSTSSAGRPDITGNCRSDQRGAEAAMMASAADDDEDRMEDPQPPDLLPQKLIPPVPDTLAFVKAKEEFKQVMNFQGLLYR